MDANLIVNGKIGRSLVVCLRNDKANFCQFTFIYMIISEPLISCWKLRWFQSLCGKAQQFQDFEVFCNQSNYLALKRKTFKITKTNETTCSETVEIISYVTLPFSTRQGRRRTTLYVRFLPLWNFLISYLKSIAYFKMEWCYQTYRGKNWNYCFLNCASKTRYER